jgi:hypothetical protein
MSFEKKLEEQLENAKQKNLQPAIRRIEEKLEQAAKDSKQSTTLYKYEDKLGFEDWLKPSFELNREFNKRPGKVVYSIECNECHKPGCQCPPPTRGSYGRYIEDFCSEKMTVRWHKREK